jgi:DNA transformation protein
MNTSADYAAFVTEQLEGLHGLGTARLFGGVGLSVDGLQFGMIIRNVLYFAVNDASRPFYEAQGSLCFSYDTKARHVDVRSYYAVPADLIEVRERLLTLAREALGAAQGRKRKPRK